MTRGRRGGGLETGMHPCAAGGRDNDASDVPSTPRPPGRSCFILSSAVELCALVALDLRPRCSCVLQRARGAGGARRGCSLT